MDYGFPANGLGEGLKTVSSGGRSVLLTYSSPYAPHRWTGATFYGTGGALLTGTRGIDTDGRVWSAAYTSGGIMQQSFTYTYDRDTVTKMVREQGSGAEESAWAYSYDACGQILSADKRYSTAGAATGNFLAGYQTDYTYDWMGNRLTKNEGGSATAGTGVRATSYIPTALNQYSSVTNSQAADITGNRASGQSIAVTASPGSTSAVVYRKTRREAGIFRSVVITWLVFHVCGCSPEGGVPMGTTNGESISATPPVISPRVPRPVDPRKDVGPLLTPVLPGSAPPTRGQR